MSPRRGATGPPGAGSSASTASSAPRPTSGIPTWSTTITRSISRRQPEDGYHLTEDITDKALEFIKDSKTIAPDKPFFVYYAPGACHAPHHAPKDWIDKFKGQFDMGYEAMREQTLARQRQMGLVPGRHRAAARQPDRHAGDATPTRPSRCPSWTPPGPGSRSRPTRSGCSARMAEVYAGFLAHADHHIGRLLDYLEESDQLDNTLVILVSDNGASGEGGPNGSVNENKMANGIPDDIAANMARYDDLGGPRRTTTTRPGGRWRSTRRSRCGSGMSSTAAPRTRASSPGPRASRRAARCATTTTTRSTSCRRSWTSSAWMRRRRSRATPRRRSTA